MTKAEKLRARQQHLQLRVSENIVTEHVESLELFYSLRWTGRLSQCKVAQLTRNTSLPITSTDALPLALESSEHSESTPDFFSFLAPYLLTLTTPMIMPKSPPSPLTNQAYLTSKKNKVELHFLPFLT